MRTRFSILSVFVLVLTVVPLVPVTASTGPLIIGEDTVLTEDHNGPVIIEALAGDVTLDCDGHRVDGGGEYEDGIWMSEQTGVTIRDCYVSGFTGAGIRVLFSADVAVLNSVVTGSYNGMALSFTDSILVSGSVATDNANNGVNLSRCGSAVIVGNTFADNARHGFASYASGPLRVTGNDAFGNGGIFDCDGGPCPDGHGFKIRQASNSVVEDNTASGNFVSGIYYGEGDSSVIEHNEADGNGAAGIEMADVSGFTLTENSTDGNVSNGIVLWRSSGNTLSENSARHNKWGFGIGEASHNNALKDNTARKNTNNGFSAFLGSTNNLLEENVACQNGGPDVWIGAGSSFLLSENRICGEVLDNNP